MQADVKYDIPLAARTTLRMGGTALAEVAVRGEADLERLPGIVEELGGDPVVLGGGSNILARDGELAIVLVRPEFEAGPEIVREEGEARLVRVGAGIGLPCFLSWLASEGLSGLEGLRGIPGMVGGAAAMNAGSWGVNFGDRLERIRIWTPEGGPQWLEQGQWECGYRHFRPVGVQGLFIVLEAELLLGRAEPERIKAAMREYFMTKRSRQPINAATAGCVFKNPEGASAGMLLDKAGFRGRGVGNVIFSEMHANFMVNLGGGSSSDALELIEAAQSTVRERFGVELELEVRIIG